MSDKPIILLDARFLRGNLYSGLARYVIETANSLSNECNDYGFVLIQNPGVEVPIQDIPRIYSSSTMLSLYQHLEFNIRGFLKDIDLYHYPHFDAPLTCGDDIIITIHDLYPIILKGYTSPVKREYFRLITGINTRRARRIIAVSNYTKRTILENFSVDEDRISVIHNGVSDIYGVVEKEDIKKTLQKYDIETPYLLYVGNAKPHKNVKRLLTAYSILPDYTKERYRLVLVGRVDEYKQGGYLNLIDELNISDSVLFPGIVEEMDMPAVYGGAELFTFISLCEGFGLPPLEAMRCGTPVLTSTAGAIVEVVGDSAVTVDPYDVEGISASMLRCLQDTDFREKLRRLGLKQSSEFSWNKVADRLMEVYEKVLSG